MNRNKINQIHLEVIDNLSKNIKKKRCDMGISQSHLSALSGVENTTISRLENMEIANPKLLTLSKLAKGLNTTIASLITAALSLANHCCIEQYLN